MQFVYTQTVQTPWGALQDSGQAFTGAASVIIEETIPSGLSELRSITASIPQAGFQCLVVLADQDVGINGSFPDDVLSVQADVMTFLTSVVGDNNAMSTSSNNAAAGTLKMRALYDPTP